MKDILQLFFSYAHSGLKSRFQYTADAIISTMAVFFREAGGVAALYLALLKFDTINGWTINEVIFLASILFLTYAIFIMFFMALRDFQDWIKHGDFDRVMLRPRGLLTQLILCGADWLAVLGHGTLGVLLFLLSANSIGIQWNFVNALYYIITIASGVLIQGAVFLFFSSLSFYVIETGRLKELFYWNAREFARYPISIYNRIVQFFMIFLVPFAFVNYFPAQFFLHKPDMAAYPEWCIYLSPLVGVLLYFAAYLFWRYSLRHYKSTGN